ncbi:hypothetical protein Tsp_06659 [Trichinella spiralis]|uniref:hypothetical protein n=1 Tax=Trichinella spiralis TaxID=6334 RepID=UPI0001EFB533|nr:hypothetical protein Tsp_06659 [Trichinella spiralis]
MNSMFLSMPVKEGGLGLRPLSTEHITRVAVGTNSMSNSTDTVSRVVADTTTLRKQLLSALEHFAVPAATKSAIREGKRNLLREEIAQLSETYQSSCLSSFKKASLRHNKIVNPDLVLVKDGAAHIVDVAVPWEKGTTMDEKHVRKVSKYTILTEDVKALFGVQTCTVGAIIIGARSSWCPLINCLSKKTPAVGKVRTDGQGPHNKLKDSIAKPRGSPIAGRVGTPGMTRAKAND